jgi:hypothetical protein
MHGRLLHHGGTTGRQLWVVILVALGLALGSQAAAATECARATPLPADVHLVAPSPEVPEAVARFAGAWTGAWGEGRGEALCHTLVVEEVLAHGYARVIYSIGTSASRGVRQPTFLRTTGRIADGTLLFHLPVLDRPNLAYRFVGEALHGTFNDTSRVRLSRVEDVSRVECGQSASGLPHPPPGRAIG